MNINIGEGSNRNIAVATAANTSGTVLTPSATAHAKGTIAELHSALPFDVHGFHLQLYMAAIGTGTNNWGIALYLGAAASEVEIHPDIVFSGLTGAAAQSIPWISVYIPLFLPRGERLSAAVQCNSVNQPTIGAMLRLNSGALTDQCVFNKATAYGYDAANTRGTLVNSGAVANTLATPVQLSASITSPIKAATLVIGSNIVSSVATTSKGMADVMIGAAASEVILFQQIAYGNNGNQVNPGATFLGLCSVPAGTRLSVRHQANSTTATTSTRESRFHVIGYS